MRVAIIFIFFIYNKYMLIEEIRDINNFDFNGSIIRKCKINNKDLYSLDYYSILKETYKIINNTMQIIKNSKLNLITDIINNTDNNFIESYNVNIEKTTDLNKILFEILIQCYNNDTPIILEIQMKNKSILNMNFKNEFMI
jgi:hypothetical protein